MEPEKLSIKKTPKVCLGKHMLFRKPFRVSILCSGQRKKLVLRNPSSPKKLPATWRKLSQQFEKTVK